MNKMEVLKKNGISIYLVILMTHCLFIGMEWQQAKFWTKLLLVPFLLLWMYVFIGFPSKGKGSWLPWIGLVGAFAGDYLLSFSNESFFLFGMIGFMITHICNCILFAKIHPIKKISYQPILIAAILLSITCSIVILQIKDQLGPFLIPIIVYMVLISIMAVLASNLYSSEHKEIAIRYFIPGAVFFVISDGILALNKFLLHQKVLEIPVMITYGFAILFLTIGFIRLPAKT